MHKTFILAAALALFVAVSSILRWSLCLRSRKTGTSTLICGSSSIRFERLIQGIQEYEKIRMSAD